MKEKIISLIFLLTIMATLPFAAIKISAKKDTEPVVATADSVSQTIQADDEILFGLTAAKFEESYCDEAVKALAIILNTNYSADKNSFDLSDENDYINDSKAQDKLGERYQAIKSIVCEAAKKTLCADGKTSFVPFSKTSNGKTVSDESLEYITAVASPWDCYSSDYNENASCKGASLNGINYLCENGYTAAEALLWYFPNLTVSEIV